jgi:predicted AlkP superfamily pyrophosphatase or phosphodiesterase
MKLPLRRSVSLAALAAAVFVAGAWARSPAPQAQRGNTLVLIGLDGFRWDYLSRPGAVHLRALAARGARAERLIPSFPSKTYPSFYTLVTGLHPENHGIVANTMRDEALGWFRIGNDPAVRDGRWFGGEPIWVTAEKQGVRTAVYFWPANESEIRGTRPTSFAGYHKPVSRADRVHRVLEFLGMPELSRPRFITTYFEDTDDAGHAVGPTGARTDTAIAAVDSVVGAIVAGIERLGRTDVNIVIVSDHGMAATAREKTIFLDDHVSLDSLEVIDWTPVAMIVPRPGRAAYVFSKLRGAHPNLTVYRKGELPPRLHFNNGARVTPIVAVADEGWTITTRAVAAAQGEKFSLGAHGFDNALLSMGGILVAAGPGVRSGAVVPPLANVHVYPLLAALLGVTPAPSDGSPDSVRALLRP